MPAAFEAAVKAADENLKSVKGLMFSGAFFAELQPWLEMFLHRRLGDVASAGGEGEVAVSIQSAGGGMHFLARAYIEPFSALVRIGELGETEEIFVWPITEVARQLKSEFPKAGHPSPPSPSWWVRFDFKAEPQKGKSPQLEKEPETVQYSGGIVYGGELAVAVIAPDGWVLDNKSGVSQGTHAVLYPRGSSWKDAPEVMYVNTGQIEPGGSIFTVIAEDVEKFKKKFPQANIEMLEAIATKSGAQAQVRAFSGGGYLNFEAIAYARLGNDVALYVLTCRDKSGYDRTIGLFRDMVSTSVLGPISFVREILEQRSRDVIIFPGTVKAARKPAVIEISGKSYVRSRFRLFDSLGIAFKELSDARDAMFSLLPKGVDTDWATAKARVLPFLDKFQQLNNEIDEDERKATAELGGDKMAKLATFLKLAKRYCAIHVKELNIIVDFLTKLANDPSDEAPFASSKEELANALAEMKAIRQDFVEELRKLNEVKVKFIKNPGS